MSHTPGPWEVWEYRKDLAPAVFHEDCGIAIMNGIGMTHQQAMENARLIAAAPDLLAACKEVARQTEFLYSLSDVHALVCAAITKATERG